MRSAVSVIGRGNYYRCSVASGPRSSADQSGRLLPVRSQVRILPGALLLSPTLSDFPADFEVHRGRCPAMSVTSATPRVAEAPRTYTSLSPAAEQRAIAGLVAGYVVCFGLLGVGIDNAFGLPAHPLLLHVPVVLIPLLVLTTIPLVVRRD